MKPFELGYEPPESGRALRSAFRIARSCMAGDLVPLSPYMLVARASNALRFSLSSQCLKARASGAHAIRSAVQTVIGAAAAFGVASALILPVSRWPVAVVAPEALRSSLERSREGNA
jgi:hypothetical protein